MKFHLRWLHQSFNSPHLHSIWIYIYCLIEKFLIFEGKSNFLIQKHFKTLHLIFTQQNNMFSFLFINWWQFLLRSLLLQKWSDFRVILWILARHWIKYMSVIIDLFLIPLISVRYYLGAILGSQIIISQYEIHA